MVYLYNGILLSHKKEGNPTFVTTWIDLESIMLSEISQSEKDKYHMDSLLVKSNEQNKQANKIETDL